LYLRYADNSGKDSWSEAAWWTRRAAEQGHVWAQVNLGLCYIHGLGVGQDVAEAVAWFQRAAHQGQSKPQILLGWCYGCGIGVNQYILGMSYTYKEKSIPPNYPRSIAWLQKAAEKGYDEAQRNLGYCYVSIFQRKGNFRKTRLEHSDVKHQREEKRATILKLQKERGILLKEMETKLKRQFEQKLKNKEEHLEIIDRDRFREKITEIETKRIRYR
jgi:TPR repeat protein